MRAYPGRRTGALFCVYSVIPDCCILRCSCLLGSAILTEAFLLFLGPSRQLPGQCLGQVSVLRLLLRPFQFTVPHHSSSSWSYTVECEVVLRLLSRTTSSLSFSNLKVRHCADEGPTTGCQPGDGRRREETGRAIICHFCSHRIIAVRTDPLPPLEKQTLLHELKNVHNSVHKRHLLVLVRVGSIQPTPTSRRKIVLPSVSRFS